MYLTEPGEDRVEAWRQGVWKSIIYMREGASFIQSFRSTFDPVLQLDWMTGKLDSDRSRDRSINLSGH